MKMNKLNNTEDITPQINPLDTLPKSVLHVCLSLAKDQLGFVAVNAEIHALRYLKHQR